MGKRPHSRIDMSEVRALQTDPARIIHQRLCGWIDPGKSGRVELDTICGYVWPNILPKKTNKKGVASRKNFFLKWGRCPQTPERCPLRGFDLLDLFGN